MKKILSTNNLSLLTIFCAPLYLIKLSLFGVPFNILELLIIITTLTISWKEKGTILTKLQKLPKMLFLGMLLILFGLFFSTLFNNNNYIASLGIIKGWFIFPIFFSLALYLQTNSSLTVDRALKSLYFSIITVSVIAILYKILAITTYDNRLTAFYLSPNYLAMYLSPGVFLALYFLRQCFLNKKYNYLFFINIIFLALIVVVLYWTYSYGAWIAINVSLIVMVPILISSKKILLSYLLLFTLILLLMFSQKNNEKFTNLFQHYSSSSLASRQTISRVSIDLILENPITGIGPGNFQERYLEMQKKYPPYLEWAVPQPHNIFLAFWLQASLFGIIGFLIVLCVVFSECLLLFKNKKNTALAATFLAFFIYILIHGLIDTPYWKNDLAFVFWIFVFSVLSLKTLEKKY
ncbi:MAG: O-antigen ligase family protein [bacterium]